MMDAVKTLPPRAEIRNIPVVHDPRSPDVAHAAGLWPFKRIVVGDDWFKLTGPEQAAVLHHEAHHVEAWHMEIRYLLLPLCWTRFAQRLAYRQELAADAFAASCGYAGDLISFISRHQYAETRSHPSPMVRVAAIMKGI